MLIKMLSTLYPSLPPKPNYLPIYQPSTYLPQRVVVGAVHPLQAPHEVGLDTDVQVSGVSLIGCTREVACRTSR